MIAKDRLILLDTNILVHVLRGKEAGRWLNTTYQLDRREYRPLISAVSFGELLALAEKWRWAPKRREKIYELLRAFVVVGIKNEVILENYAKLSTYWERAGKRLEQNDLWIAASAVATGAILITTDVDFKKLTKSIHVEWVDTEHLKSLKPAPR